MKKKYYCKDCNKEIGSQAALYGQKRCSSCSKIGNKNSRYKQGIYLREHFCKSCNKKITVYAKYCKDCYYKYPPFTKEKKKCIECGVEISRRAIRCKKCSIMFNRKENSARWIERSNCLVCGNKVKTLKAKVCGKCKNYYIWTLPHYTKAISKSMCCKPNKPEKIIINLLANLFKKDYKYVGNGKFWIENFNPDFININGRKKIIELYGDYWHTLTKTKERDERRIEKYKKYGYDTLIIWEKELKNLNKVSNRLIKFNLK